MKFIVSCGLGACLATLLLASGCALAPSATTPSDSKTSAPAASPTPPQAPAPPSPEPPTPAPAPTPPPSVVELSARRGEQALLSGLRAYDDGQYTLAEQKLKAALAAGLASPKDRAAAHKTLAFVYCTSKREKPCESAFRAARSADPQFALSKAEAGHPLWGPVYRRVAAKR